MKRANLDGMQSRLRGAALVVATLFALVGCNDQGGLPPQQAYAPMRGVVVDALTKTPIAGAVVTVETVLSATTDASGHFSIAQVPIGTIDYTVRAPGYLPVRTTLDVAPSKPVLITVALTARSVSGSGRPLHASSRLRVVRTRLARRRRGR